MIFYDLNLKGSNFDNDSKIIREAYDYGWNHLNIIYSTDNYEDSLNYREKLNDAVSSFDDFDITYGLELKVKNQNELRKSVQKYRKKVDYLSVFGGRNDINRAALENYKVDVLSRPYYRRGECGMNHVLAKESLKNNVAIELCFKDILTNFLSYRAKVLSNFRDIINLYRKFKFPLIVTSGCESIFDSRTPYDIMSFFKVLGLNDDELKDVFYNYPKQIIDFSKDKNLIYPGVRLID
ncbi:MAG: ribonuclease P protein component 3 [Methanobrevibacter sp.]